MRPRPTRPRTASEHRPSAAVVLSATVGGLDRYLGRCQGWHQMPATANRSCPIPRLILLARAQPRASHPGLAYPRGLRSLTSLLSPFYTYFSWQHSSIKCGNRRRGESWTSALRPRLGRRIRGGWRSVPRGRRSTTSTACGSRTAGSWIRSWFWSRETCSLGFTNNNVF